VFKAMAQAGVANGDEQQAIARALHDLGQVAYFADVPDLAAKVILKPDWLDARITQVIDSQAVADAGGMLSRDERYRLWGDLIASEDDPDLLDRLLRMMESFDLAYRIGDAQDSEDVALIVDRLPESRPGDIERMWQENAAGPGMREIGIIYKLASRQAGIPSWFIAREHRYTTELHWRNGVLLHDRDPRFPAWALLVDDGREQPTITLRVAGPYPVRFLSVLTEALDNIVDHRYPGLIEEMLVPCACESENGLRCVNAFTLEELLAEATAEEPDADHKVRCSKSRRRIEAAVMLDGLRGTGLTAELDAIKDRLDAHSSTLNAIEAAHQRGINSLRILLEDRAHAGAHCPALFSITPDGRSRVPRFERFILSLWCEWPDGPHILDDDAGRYPITKVPAALTRYLPYLRHLITALGLVTPGLASAGIDLSARAQAGIEAATKTL
jgi:internalin A